MNKYFLYTIIVLALGLPTVGRKLYYKLTYAHTTGIIAGSYPVEKRTKYGIRVTRYPRIVFEAEGKEVTFYAPGFMSGNTCDGCKVWIMYDRKHPEKAFIDGSLGLFGTDLVWLLPVFLMLTGCFFAPGIIPKKIRINSNDIDKKLFD